MRVFKRKKPDRAPFRALQQRSPGQSLRVRFFDIATNSSTGFVLVMCAAVLALVHLLLPDLMLLAIAGMTLSGACLAIPSTLAMIRLSKGVQAEAHVGQFLQTLERRGAYVLHDVCRSGFNIDHVVIAQSGVYVIETKYVSKAGRGGREVIACRDGVLTRNGRQMRGDALGQVRRATEEVGRMTRALGYAPPLRPVLVFPGWWTQSAGPAWVLNERAVLKWIARARPVMTADETRKLYLALRAPAVVAA